MNDPILKDDVVCTRLSLKERVRILIAEHGHTLCSAIQRIRQATAERHDRDPHFQD